VLDLSSAHRRCGYPLSALATTVTIGLRPRPVGMRLESTTKTLSAPCKRQKRLTMEVVGSSPIRQVPINLQGLTIPPALLARADEVIE